MVPLISFLMILASSEKILDLPGRLTEHEFVGLALTLRQGDAFYVHAVILEYLVQRDIGATLPFPLPHPFIVDADHLGVWQVAFLLEVERLQLPRIEQDGEPERVFPAQHGCRQGSAGAVLVPA